MYVVVEFENEYSDINDIAVVPQVWLISNDRKCYWPNRITRKKFGDYIKNQHVFQKNWPLYKVNKVHFKTDNYNEAESKIETILQNDEKEFSNSSSKSLNRRVLRRSDSVSTSGEENSPPTKKQKQVNVELKNNAVTPVEVCDISTPTSSLILTPSSSISSRQSNFENSVLTCLSSLKENIDQHSIILNELLRSARKTNEISIVPPEELPNFPMNSLETFQNFDQKLAEGVPLTKYMVSRLAAIGGSNVEYHTRRMLKYVITNEVAILFNWKGRDKISFEKTNLMKVIYDAAKVNYPLKERNDLTVAKAVKDWLKFAKARMLKQKE